MVGGATWLSVHVRKFGSSQLDQMETSDLRGLDPSTLAPVRTIQNYHGQHHRVGWYASTKAGRHLDFESMIEMMRMQFLDFDPSVSTFASQPFTLRWQEGKQQYRYTPDLLVIRPGRLRLVEEVKPVGWEPKPRAAHVLEQVREALARVGIAFAVWHPPAPVVVRNVQYLASYRRQPASLGLFQHHILSALREHPHMLGELGTDPLARPAIYHLIWQHRIVFDLDQPLSQQTLLRLAEVAA